MLMRVCVLAICFVFTSLTLAQDKDKSKSDDLTQDAKQIWQDAIDEVTTAQQALDDSEVALKNLDKKDKKLAAETRKEVADAKKKLAAAKRAAETAFKNVLKSTSLRELAVIYIPTVLKPTWFEGNPKEGFFAKTPGLLSVPADTWEAGKAFGWTRINPGERTIIRGGFGGGLPNNTMLVATIPDEGSGIGIQGKKPQAIFMELNESGELGEPHVVTPEFRDGGWQFLGTGKGIFLIYNLSEETYK